MISISGFASALSMEIITDGGKTTMNITTSDVNRPGLQFAGFFEYFAYERPQLIGKVEMVYLENMEQNARRDLLEKYFSYNLPCVIICRNLKYPKDLVEYAEKNNVPVFRASTPSAKMVHNTMIYLNNSLAPRVTRHGVLVDVYGTGILITGDSGIGKSECALELIKRGHRLVADDVVDIRRVNDDRLIGESPESVRHFMEIRGIGIIDIRSMYGIGSVLNSKSIEFITQLELWDPSKAYDRLGLEEETQNILGVRVPIITLPVRPGRNLAIILEVAARNHRLKENGYHSARNLIQSRLNLAGDL